ncbi:MAG: thioredoxin [Alistipes sp.]|nr:thioredoxin [Alistipes sp.]
MKKVQKILIGTLLALMPGIAAFAQQPSETKKQQPMKAIELTTAEFQKQIYDYRANPEWKYEGDLPAVIDFYAAWCGPCKMMAPVMETLAEEYSGKIRVYKVDVDKEKRLAAMFHIRSIPSFLFIPLNGEPKHANGAMDIERMRQIIDATLLQK